MDVQTKLDAGILLKIDGPFLTRGTAASGYIADLTILRDPKGNPYIDKSHIKGTLRAAVGDLLEKAPNAFARFNVDVESRLFGKGNTHAGLLSFTNFCLHEGNAQSGLRARVAVNPETGTAAGQALYFIEDAFPAGTTSSWTGRLTIVEDDELSARKVLADLLMAWRWFEAMGGNKTVGFGTVAAVDVREKRNSQCDIHIFGSDDKFEFKSKTQAVKKVKKSGKKNAKKKSRKKK